MQAIRSSESDLHHTRNLLISSSSINTVVTPTLQPLLNCDGETALGDLSLAKTNVQGVSRLAYRDGWEVSGIYNNIKQPI